jgi:endonuclease/exonuclease/phosphatase family metal-dependent hydrolase
MAFTRLEDGPCIANLHASKDDGLAAAELLAAADRAVEWAAGAPLVLGGDFNLRPRQSEAFGELARRHGLSEPAEPDAIDHLLARGLEVVDASRAWPAHRRELDGDGLALRLSDHAPVQAHFRTAGRTVR